MTLSLAPQITQPLTPVAESLGASIINLPLDESTDAIYVRRITDLIHEFLAEL
jgi:hypothetical protein